MHVKHTFKRLCLKLKVFFVFMWGRSIYNVYIIDIHNVYGGGRVI